MVVTFCSCKERRTIERQIVELEPTIKLIVSKYIAVIKKNISPNERFIYIELSDKSADKVLMITNDFLSPCITDTIFDYYTEIDQFRIIILGKDDELFRPKKRSFKQFKICQDSIPKISLITFSPEVWFIYFDKNNEIINLDVPPIRKKDLFEDSLIPAAGSI